MTITAIREKLHQYLDSTDDKHIQDMFHYVENTEHNNYSVAGNEMEELERRAASCVNGTSVSYTAEEAHSYIRSQKPFQIF